MGSLILFMGATGAGKSFHAERLASEFGWVHISSGDLLRADPTFAAAATSGELVDDEIVEAAVRRALVPVPVHLPVVLDGFPRTLSEAAWLDTKLPGIGREITHVVFLDVTRATSDARLLTRGRADDMAAALDEKWREFTDRTRPVIENYRHDHQGFARIDADLPADEAYGQIKNVFR